MTGIGSGSRGGLVGGGLGSGLSLEGRLGGFVVLTSSLVLVGMGPGVSGGRHVGGEVVGEMSSGDEVEGGMPSGDEVGGK